MRTHPKNSGGAAPGGASGFRTITTTVPPITAIMNEAAATAAAPAAQPTCRREFGDCSKIPRKVAAKPPRKALREAICLPISEMNWRSPVAYESSEKKLSHGSGRRKWRRVSGRLAKTYHSLKSPACSCVSITLPASSQTRITALPGSSAVKWNCFTLFDGSLHDCSPRKQII